MRVGTRIGWLLVIAPCGSGMALIPAGSFTMGDADTSSADAQPPHRVTLSAFCVDLTEVTVADWRRCTAARCTAPDTGTACIWSTTPGARESHPINCVNWNQARFYCLARGADLARGRG